MLNSSGIDSKKNDPLTEVLKVSRYAIFASGSGSNALSLIEEGLRINCPPLLVISNVEEAPVLKKARNLGVESVLIPSQVKGLDPHFEKQAIELCQKYQIEWLFLAGFLKILSPEFLKAFQWNHLYRVVNIHPSLLPKYPGLGAYKKAYKNGDEVFGHSVHLVDEGVDEGPLLYQRELVRPQDCSFAEFCELGKREENKSYAKVLNALIGHGLKVSENNIGLQLD